MLKKYGGYVELASIIVLSIFGLLRGEVTVFYMMYLFWWQALIHVVAAAYHSWRLPGLGERLRGQLFLLGLYFVFIIIFFGLMQDWYRHELMFINIQVFLFRNPFFDLNLVFFILSAFCQRSTAADNSIFGPRQIVLHISIVVGGLLQFFVVKRYPQYFAESSYWSSVVVIMPFLLLKVLVSLWYGKKVEKEQDVDVLEK